MSDNVVIKVDNVSKNFKLPHDKNTSIKSALINFYKKKRTYEEQNALIDISLEVKEGEFFGIVGRNGSGKSTLLKLLAGIYTPSGGNIQVKGKLTPFIELGVGFNQELSGRENVFLNGALLGFSRSEIEAMYDDIVRFSELERFMDQKLKNYSSGMQVRLAFSVAIQAKSDILILDEVLAVGDEAFQKKCIDVFEQYKAEKKTVVLVTHDMSTVKRFCSRAVLISDGLVSSEGDPDKVAQAYTDLNNQAVNKSVEDKNIERSKAYKTKLKLKNQSIVEYGDEISLDIDWSACTRSVKNVGVAVYGNAGEYIFGTNTVVDDFKIGSAKKLTYKIKANAGSGNYHFKVGIFGKDDQDVIELIHDGPEFIIKNDPTRLWQGLMHMKHEWIKK